MFNTACIVATAKSLFAGVPGAILCVGYKVAYIGYVFHQHNGYGSLYEAIYDMRYAIYALLGDIAWYVVTIGIQMIRKRSAGEELAPSP